MGFDGRLVGRQDGHSLGLFFETGEPVNAGRTPQAASTASGNFADGGRQ
jgi:hypothetical protein